MAHKIYGYILSVVCICPALLRDDARLPCDKQTARQKNFKDNSCRGAQKQRIKSIPTDPPAALIDKPAQNIV